MRRVRFDFSSFITVHFHVIKFRKFIKDAPAHEFRVRARQTRLFNNRSSSRLQERCNLIVLSMSTGLWEKYYWGFRLFPGGSVAFQIFHHLKKRL